MQTHPTQTIYSQRDTSTRARHEFNGPIEQDKWLRLSEFVFSI